MMQCRDIDELMVEYLYQELEPARAAEFEAHVETCARCGAELGSLQRTRQALRALPEAEPPPALSARLLHEASRRAPKPEGSGLFAWLGRLFQPLIAHPAWAAAASVILLLAVTTFVSVRGHVSPSTQTVDSEQSPGAPHVATAPSSGTAAPTPATPPADQPAAAGEKAPSPEGTVAGGAETGELARGPTTEKFAAEDKSSYRGRASSADEQRTLDAMQKKKAADVRRDVTDALKMPPKAEAPKAAHAAKPAAPAPAKAAPPPAKEEAASAPAGVVAETSAEGYAEGERAPSQPAADEKSRAKDDDLRSQRSSIVAQAPAPAESRPEPQAKPQTKGAAAEPTPPPAAAASPPPPPPAPAPAQTAASETNSRDASKNDANRNEVAKGKAPARNQTANGASSQQNNAPSAKNVQAANTDSAGNATGNVAGNDRAAEAPEQQMYRQAQKSAAGGQCDDALTLTNKIARIYPDFYKKNVVGDKTIQTCTNQQRKSKAQSPAPAKQREVDQADENKAAK